MKKDRFIFKIILTIEFFILLFFLNDTLKHLILKYFGYSVFILPLGLLYINFTILTYSTFFLYDNFFQILPYKLCGVIGEYIVLINNKLYFLPILISLLIISFLIYNNYKRIDSVFDILDNNIELKTHENQSNLLLKVLEKYSIKTEIKKIEFNKIYTRYYLNIPYNIKFNRFSSLSPDLSSILKLKIKTTCDLQYSYIDIENKNKFRIYLSEFKNKINPNKILLLDCTNVFLLDVKNNFLLYVSKQVIHSFICSLLITSINLNILLINEDDISFYVYNNLILNDKTTKIDDIIKEIERRYREIIPVAEDIYQYNQQRNCSMNFLVIFFKLNNEIDENLLNYVIQFGKKVGVFVFSYSDDLNNIKKYNKLFQNIILSNVDEKSDSINLIGTSWAEYLCNQFDCILKYDEMLIRISVPEIPLDELSKITKYMDISN